MGGYAKSTLRKKLLIDAIVEPSKTTALGKSY